MVIPFVITVAVAGVVSLAEWLHGRRVARVARLAFGADARPARWARAAPFLRVAAAAALAWGAATLMMFDPVETDARPTREASKHLLVCLDVSPSMLLADAGPGAEKVRRGRWAGELVQGILDRLDTETTRVTLFAFYTKALPVIHETYDKEVIHNALDGLPMYVAFEPGPTDMHLGVSQTLRHAKVWPRNSSMLVIVSDGDTSAGKYPISLPDSIADVLVIGVGDPYKSLSIAGHPSRQDAGSLKQLALRLGGQYHDGNQKHVPSRILDRLSLTSPRQAGRVTLRDAALASAGIGGGVLALLGPMLVMLGRPAHHRRARSEVRRRAKRSAKKPQRGRGAPAVERSTGSGSLGVMEV